MSLVTVCRSLGGVAVWLIFACAAMASRTACAWELPDLMKMLAAQNTSRASFVERKYLHLVDVPLESKGDLYYQAPDRFEKRITSPRKESLLLAGDELTVERQGKRPMKLSLANYPEVGVFVQSIRGTLLGDLQALKRYYQVRLTGHAERWRLELVPVQDSMKRIITRIRIEGSQAAVSFIGFDQADGDRSEMVITPTGRQ